MQRLRTSFAAKLVALELGTIVVAVTALAGFLIAARLSQTRELERNVARANVDGLRRVIADAGGNAAGLAQQMATFPTLIAIFDNDRPRLTATVEGVARSLGSEHTLVVLDASGHALLARQGGAAAVGSATD